MKAILTVDIINTVLDRDVVLAHAGATVVVLADNGDNYEVAYYEGSTPSATFYVSPSQVRLIE